MKRTVLITGGARGLGQAIRMKFESAGFHVLSPLRAELDLGQPESIESYLRGVGNLEIDILVNNAGLSRPEKINDVTMKSFCQVQQVNLNAPFRLIQKYSEGMKSRKWGRIINIGSVFGLISRPGRSAYSASKAGVLGLTRAAALELGPFNILVNSVCPGFFRTDMTAANNTADQIDALESKVALRRLGLPTELAEVVFFLSSDSNSFITGQEIVVDGGLMAGMTE